MRANAPQMSSRVRIKVFIFPLYKQLTMPSEPAMAVSTAINTLSKEVQLIDFDIFAFIIGLT